MVKLVRGPRVLSASLAQSLSALLEYHRAVGFREYEEQGPHRQREEQLDSKNPEPAWLMINTLVLCGSLR